MWRYSRIRTSADTLGHLTSSLEVEMEHNVWSDFRNKPHPEKFYNFVTTSAGETRLASSLYLKKLSWTHIYWLPVMEFHCVATWTNE